MPRESWIIVEHTHEPIIDRHTFDLVQELQKQRTKSVNMMPDGVFSGKLFCADCKKSMERQYARRGKRETIGYVCKTYRKQGKRFCESHKILREELEWAVLSSLRKEVKKILTPEDIEKLQRINMEKQEREDREEQLEMLQEKIGKLQKYKKGAFEKYLDNAIMESDYRQFTAQYDSQIAALEQHMRLLSEIEFRMDRRTDLNDIIHMEKLDRRIVVELIERIEAGKDGELTIYYKFADK